MWGTRWMVALALCTGCGAATGSGAAAPVSGLVVVEADPRRITGAAVAFSRDGAQLFVDSAGRVAARSMAGCAHGVADHACTLASAGAASVTPSPDVRAEALCVRRDGDATKVYRRSHDGVVEID